MGRHRRSLGSRIERRLKGKGGLPLVEALASVCAGAVIVMGVLSPSTVGHESNDKAPLYTTSSDEPTLDDDRMDASVFRYGLDGSCDFGGVVDLPDDGDGDRIQINLRLTENPYMDEIRLRRGDGLVLEPTTSVVRFLTPEPDGERKDAEATDLPSEFLISANGQDAIIETVVPKEMPAGARVAVLLGNGATTATTNSNGETFTDYSYSEQFCWSVADGKPDPFDPVYFHPFSPWVQLEADQLIEVE